MALNYGNRIVEDSIVFHLDFANRKCFAPNILNYSHWTVSSGTVPQDSTRYGVTRYQQMGLTAENTRVLGTDPFGYGNSIVWRSQNSEASSNSEGGWDSGDFAIDTTKLYRFSVWTKRDAMTAGPATSGSFYLGTFPKDSAGVPTFSIAKGSGAIVDYSAGGPYFMVTPNSNPSSQLADVQAPYLGGLNVWSLVVGHVWPTGTTTGVNLPGTNINGLASNANHPDSGVWTRSNGKIGNLFGGNGEFVWYAPTRTCLHRAYFYYAIDLTSVQSFIYPRVDVVDGLEPSIEELLTGPEPVRDMTSDLNTLYPVSLTDFDIDQRGLNFYGDPRFAITGNIGATFSVLSVSCWVRPNTIIDVNTSSMTVIQFGSNNSQSSPDGKLTIEIGGNTSAGAFTVVYRDALCTRRFYSGLNFVLPANQWTNLCAVWDPSTTEAADTQYLLYVNGVKINQFTNESGVSIQRKPKNICDFVSVGSRYESSAYSLIFAGKIGSTLVHNRSLTPSEVRDNFNNMKQKYGII